MDGDVDFRLRCSRRASKIRYRLTAIFASMFLACILAMLWGDADEEDLVSKISPKTQEIYHLRLI